MRPVHTLLIALVALAFTAGGVRADAVVFPKNGSVGLVPPAAMQQSPLFAGFESRPAQASIIIVEMPKAAYRSLADGMTPAALKSKGIELSGPIEDVSLPGSAEGKLMRGTQTAGRARVRKWILMAQGAEASALVTVQARAEEENVLPEPRGPVALPDSAIEAALRTLTFRAPLSIGEQMAALPFQVGDSAGMRPVRVVAGSSVYYTEGPQDVVRDGSQPVIIIGSSLRRAPAPPMRESYARKLFLTIPGVKSLQITRVDASKTSGSEWVQVSGLGRDRSSDTPMAVEQIIRFDGSRYVRVVGIVPEIDRSTFTGRFERLASSVTQK
jgi:hypothetical protein